MRRQKRYRQSGVRGLWLLRQPNFPYTKELPAACIDGSLEKGLTILIPRYGGDTAPRNRRCKHDWLPALTPEAFLRAVFEKRFRFGAEHAREARALIQTTTMKCWYCGQRTRIAIGLKVHIGPYEWWEDLSLADEMPHIRGKLREALANDQEIGSLHTRHSQRAQRNYISNSCGHCRMPIGRSYEPKPWRTDTEESGEITWTIDETTQAALGLPHGTEYWKVWEPTPGHARSTHAGKTHLSAHRIRALECER